MVIILLCLLNCDKQSKGCVFIVTMADVLFKTDLILTSVFVLSVELWKQAPSYSTTALMVQYSLFTNFKNDEYV